MALRLPRSMTRKRGAVTPSACQFSGVAITVSPSMSTTRMTVTFGTPPIL